MPDVPGVALWLPFPHRKQQGKREEEKEEKWEKLKKMQCHIRHLRTLQRLFGSCFPAKLEITMTICALSMLGIHIVSISYRFSNEPSVINMIMNKKFL